MRSDSSVEDDVWAMEESYWRYVQAGDVEGFLSLWHENFVGWPSQMAQPVTRATGDRVQRIREKHIRVTYGSGTRMSPLRPSTMRSGSEEMSTVSRSNSKQTRSPATSSAGSQSPTTVPPLALPTTTPTL